MDIGFSSIVGLVFCRRLCLYFVCFFFYDASRLCFLSYVVDQLGLHVCIPFSYLEMQFLRNATLRRMLGFSPASLDVRLWLSSGIICSRFIDWSR